MTQNLYLLFCSNQLDMRYGQRKDFWLILAQCYFLFLMLMWHCFSILFYFPNTSTSKYFIVFICYVFRFFFSIFPDYTTSINNVFEQVTYKGIVVKKLSKYTLWYFPTSGWVKCFTTLKPKLSWTLSDFPGWSYLFQIFILYWTVSEAYTAGT